MGCHAKNLAEGRSGFEPLGRLADAATRKARSAFHEVFDQLWKNKHMSRAQAYEWLRTELGISAHECHGAMFDEDRAVKALSLSKVKLQEYISGSLPTR